MAAAILQQRCGEFFDAYSAGLEAGALNAMAVAALAEIGIDISQNKTQTVDDVLASGEHFAYVITVCSESEAAGCPLFPGAATRLHWPFPDPSRFEGDYAAKLKQTRALRDAIKRKIDNWCQSACTASALAG